MAMAFLAVFLLGACSPEEFSGADQSKIPSMEGVNVDWQVDEETNTVTASVPDLKGAYPLWYITWNNSKGAKQEVYSTLPTLSKQFKDAGDYTISLKLGNRNGFSQNEVSKSFHFTKSQVDWSAISSKLCGTADKPKTWRIDRKAVGHIGCGPDGTAGTEWWTAKEDEKIDFGVYDDRITFTMASATGGTYTYDPGADGKMLVNKGTTVWGSGASDDFDAEVQAQSTGFSLESDFYTPNGSTEEVQANYIVLDAKSLFPYIADDKQYNEPKFRIESITATKLELVYDIPGSIAWHYILTSTEDTGDSGDDEPEATVDWDWKADNNLWTPYLGTVAPKFWYAPGWSQIDDPEYSFNNDGGFVVTLPEGTTGQWQAQMSFETDMTAALSDTYNFYCVLNSSEDHPGVTLKFTETNETNGDEEIKHDDNYFFADKVALKAGKDYVFKKEGVVLPKNNAHALSLVFDFGGNAAGSEISVSKIYFEKVQK